MARHIGTAKSTSPEPESEREAASGGLEEELSDDDGQEILAPRKTKLQARHKWEMLMPRQKATKSNTSTGAAGRKKAPNAPKVRRTQNANASATYLAPDSIQLNTSGDSDDSLPAVVSPNKSSRGSSRGDKDVDDMHKPTRKMKASAEVSNRKPKTPSKSSGPHTRRNKDVESESEELAEDEAEDEEEEDEEDDEDGAPAFDAEGPFWADGDNSGEGENDRGPIDPAADSPRRSPPPSKHHRARSRSGSEGELSSPARPPPRKKAKAKADSDIDNISKSDDGAPRLAVGKLIKKSVKGKDKPAEKAHCIEDWRDKDDSEHERAKAKAKVKARQKQREREKERAKGKEGKRKEMSKGVSTDKAKVAKQKVLKESKPAPTGSHASGQRSASSSKRKHDEFINWADKDKDVTKGGDRHTVPAKKRRADVHSGSDDSSDSELDEDDTNIDIQCDAKGRLNLGEQAPRVRRIARLAIFAVKKFVLLKCAFPDGAKDLQDQARSALIRCAQDAGYRDMAKRLKDDNQEDYWRRFSSLAAQRAFSLRGIVKKTADGAVAGVYGMQPGNAEKVEWLQRNLAFIYPHDYKALQVQSQGKLAFTLPIFESVLRTAFYDNPRSFGYKILDCFESSLLERPHEKEIPASMLALVATAVYASLDDYRPSKYRAGKFEANIYTPVFKHCISFLSKMKSKQPNKYHALMHGFYQCLTGTTSGVDDFDDDAIADFSADEE